ncbi:hypothetical protein BSKO_06279 [Bryopsis sp. KO-2023]|nr:hypothetical protein BSKO_06279 [Bryopsis sp. KO-2023]
MPVIHRRSVKLWLPEPTPRDEDDSKNPESEIPTEAPQLHTVGHAPNDSDPAHTWAGGSGLQGGHAKDLAGECKRSNASSNGGDELDDLMREYEKQAAADLKSIRPAPKKAPKMMDRLEDGLSTRIEGNNKGWQLLAKMGYKEGEGLGVKKQGMKDPVEVNLKRGRGGLGTEKPSKRRKDAAKRKGIVIGASHVAAYRCNKSNKYEDRRMEEQVGKARGVVENLDVEMGLQRTHLWPPEEKECEEGEEGGNADEKVEVEDPNSEWEALPVSDRLMEILMYLRRNHRYCFWCGDKFGDAEGDCPGVLESDH